MKTVVMNRTFEYRPLNGVIIVYEGGNRYKRVPEYAVREILKAEAGSIVRTERPHPGDKPVS